MTADDNLLTDPIRSSSDSPPLESIEVPPSPDTFSTPESLIIWSKKKLFDIREGVYLLLISFGFIEQDNIFKFNNRQKYADDNIGNATSLPSRDLTSQSRKRESSAFEINVPSKYQALSLKGESDESSGSNVASIPQTSPCKGESVISSGLRVASMFQATPYKDESVISSELNVASILQASSYKGESDISYVLNLASFSQASPYKGESVISSGLNVASTLQASPYKGEYVISSGLNVASIPQASPYKGKSDISYGLNVVSIPQASPYEGESVISSGLNLVSIPQASECMSDSSISCLSDGESASPNRGESVTSSGLNVASIPQPSTYVDDSSTDFLSDGESASPYDGSARTAGLNIAYPQQSECMDDSSMNFISNPSRSTNRPSGNLADDIGRDFAQCSVSHLREIDNFCTKFMQHQDVCKQVEAALLKLEQTFMSKRMKQLWALKGWINLKKYMPLLNGLKELRFVVEKIFANQNVLCEKLHCIMRRKNRLDQIFRERNAPLTAQKDNRLSYLMYWIFRNLMGIDRLVEKKRKYHIVFERVQKKVQQQLEKF